MKRSLVLSLVLGTCIVLTSAVAVAGPWGGGGGKGGGHGGDSDSDSDSGRSGSVPEIDPAALGAAVTLLGGGLAVLTDRRRKK